MKKKELKQKNVQRRDPIKVALNEYERSIVEEKMKSYGYKYISAYLRDAGIYENIIVEKVEGKEEILDYLSNMIELLKDISRKQNKLYLRASLSPEDIIMIKKQNAEIMQCIEELKKQVVERMEISFRKEYVRSKIDQGQFVFGEEGES